MSAPGKASLRIEAEEARSRLGPEERARRAEGVRAILRLFAPVRGAQRLALYAAVGAELPTAGVFADLRMAGKRVALPCLDGDDLRFREIDSWAALRPGPLRIPEPPPEAPSVGAGEIDVWLVPGVAFDRLGHRLGRGRGYYDRALKRARPDATRVGLCFELQLLAEVPAEAHDLRMDFIVTEARVLGPMGGAGATRSAP